MTSTFSFAAVRLHGHSLPARTKAMRLAVGRKADADLGLRRVGQLLDLEAVGLDEVGCSGSSGFEQVDVLLAVAIGGKEIFLPSGAQAMP